MEHRSMSADVVAPVAVEHVGARGSEVRLILQTFPVRVGVARENGEPSENLQRVQQFVNRWRNAVPDVPIEFFDERFTSVLAHQAMIDGGLRKKARQDKALVDEISATIILEDYLRSRK